MDGGGDIFSPRGVAESFDGQAYAGWRSSTVPGKANDPVGDVRKGHAVLSNYRANTTDLRDVKRAKTCWSRDLSRPTHRSAA